jgi:hypothetical protein
MNKPEHTAAIPVSANRQSAQRTYRTHGDLRRILVPVATFVLLMLGCSAADLVQRERDANTPLLTATPVALHPTFTPTPVPPQQTVVIVTPPSENQPGVIIVPPGMDPRDVIPILPTATPTTTPSQTPIPEATATVIVVVPPDANPISLLPTPAPGTPSMPVDLLPTPTSAVDGQPVELIPTSTPSPTVTPVPLIPTDTPTPTETPTPTATSTPFVVVEGGLVALRTGPGIDYPLLAQLGPNIQVAVIGRNEDSSWLEICCISGQTVWVVTSHVIVTNDISGVPVSVAAPPPAPTPTPIPTETPTVTPTPTATLPPFDRAIGPQFFPTSNEYITIWAKIYIGVSPFEQPLPDHFLTVKFEGFERPNAIGHVPSTATFEFSAPPGSGNRVQYNYKYEYRPPDPATINSEATRLQLIGTGMWTVYVSDGAGNRLSEEVTFTTAPSNPNREIYIGWVRVR